MAGAAILAMLSGCMAESGITTRHKVNLAYVDAFSLCQAVPSSQKQMDAGAVHNAHQMGILDFKKEWQEDLYPEDTRRFKLVKQVRSKFVE